jgi:hypothetical protein
VSFLLDLKENGKHVGLLATTDLELAERFGRVLAAAGFAVTAKHQPDAAEFSIRKNEGGSGAN